MDGNTFFLITRHPDGFTIARNGEPDNRLFLGDGSELLLLRARLNAFVDNPTPDATIRQHARGSTSPLIDGKAAVALAAQAGIQLQRVTLVAACANGRIPGAVKQGARWVFPQAGFEEYLERFQQETRGRPHSK